MIEPKQVAGSVQYLVEKFSVDQREALRRLELQSILPSLAEELQERFPTEYAGAWLDQENGGVAKIATTDTTRVDRVLSAIRARFKVETVQARWSLKQLAEAAERAEGVLGAKDPSGLRYLVDVDEVANRVNVFERGASDAISRAATASALPAGLPPDQVVVRPLAMPGRSLSPDTGPSNSLLAPPSCNIGNYAAGALLCDKRSAKKMAGGKRLDVLRDNGSYGGCTNGFNISSTISPRNGWYYTLTAGHCILGANHANQDFTWHGSTAVGYEHDHLVPPSGNLAFDVYPTDYAIMGYSGSQVHTWLIPYPTERNRVLHTSTNPQGWWYEVPVNGLRTYSSAAVGTVVCATGSGTSSANFPNTVDSGAGAGYYPGTRCGQITAKNGGFVTNICSRRGDSGGPLFTQGATAVAYGLLSDGTNASGPCGSNEQSWYSPISRIFDRVNSIPGNYGYRIVT